MRRSANTRSNLPETLESRRLLSSSLLPSTAVPTIATPAVITATKGTGLTGEYFIGDDFQTATVVRTDARINFNWPLGRPDGSIPKGEFTARWTGTVESPTTGVYTFYTEADSGTQVIVNGTTIISNFSARTASTQQGDISLTAGVPVSIEVDYVSKGSGSANMKLLWSADGVKQQVVPQSALFAATGVTLPANQALTGTYYTGYNFKTEVMTRVDPGINFNFGTGVPDTAIPLHTPFSVVWTGQITPATTGFYVFETITDDGVRLFVNGKRIINDWHVQSAKPEFGGIQLSADQSYTVTMQYFQDGAGHDSAKLLSALAGHVERFVKFTVPAALAAPLDVTASAFSSTQINLNWDDVTGETGFTVERSTDGGETFSVVGATGQGVTAFSDTGLTPSTAYVYEVIATSAVASSPASAEATATTPVAIPAPAVASATVSGTTATISWTAVPTAASYLVERSPDGVSNFTTVGTTSGTSLPDTGLADGTTYYYRVTSSNAAGSAAPSNVVSITTAANALASPMLEAATVSNTENDLSWTAVTGATSYLVETSPDGTSNFTSVTTTSSTSVPVTGLSGGTIEYYRVTASNSTETSAPSNVASATTEPDAPTLAATVSSDTQINLSWNDVTGETGFIVQQSANGTSGWTQVATTGTGVTTQAIAGLTGATTYHFRVIATGVGGNSAASNVATSTTTTAVPTYASLTTIYGLTDDDKVYSLNTSNGAVTPIGTLSFGTNAAGRDPISGNFYYFSVGSNTPAISAWNPTTGANTVITTGTSLDGSTNVAAFRDDGALFTATSAGTLYSISRTTGVSTALGTLKLNGSTLDVSNGDIAFGPDGNLYVFTNSNLYEVTKAAISAATGTGSSINTTLVNSPGKGSLQIAFGQDGVLYGVSASGQLYEGNTVTGPATAVGSPSGVDLGDLASIPLNADLSISQTSTTFTHGQTGSYSINVTNSGPDATVGPVQVIDTLPTGLSFVSGAGTGWTFSVNGQVVTLTYNGTVHSGVLPTATVTVQLASTVTSPVSNTVTVSTTIFDQQTSNNSSTISTAVN